MALISLATLAYSSFAVNIITLPTDIFPKEVVASVYGITGITAGIGGMIFTLITGRVVDKISYVLIFVLAGVQPAVSALILVFMLGKVERLSVPAPAVAALVR